MTSATEPPPRHINTFRIHDPGPQEMAINDEGAHATEQRGLNGNAMDWSKSHLPDISRLQIADKTPLATTVTVPEDIVNAASSDPAMERLRVYAQSLPYSVEPNSRMQELLDFILMRIVQCVKAKDFDPGFMQWDSMLSYWFMLKYPMPKEKRAALVKLYFEVATLPGMPAGVINVAVEGITDFTRSKKKLTIKDLRMPWKPIYELLSNELFLPRRKFELNQIPDYMGRLADSLRRFFHPATVNEMLETFLPLINGSSVNSILSSEYYLLSFLPQTHPQSYLSMLFRMWKTMNSYTYDGRMLEFLGELAEIHVDPTASDPQVIKDLPDDAKSEGEGRPNWMQEDLKHEGPWRGLFKDVGIYTDDEWQFIMCKCLAVMEIPLNDAGSLTTGPSVDKQASFEVKKRLPSFNWRISSLAKLIVYSMATDSLPVPPSGISTPFTPGTMTPVPEQNNLGDYLSSPLGKKSKSRIQTYLAGSKALDSLAHMIASCESFFHPTNSGAWTSDLTAFIKYVVYEFNKRWYEEQKPTCKTPFNKRLTREMKRELVKCLRTVCLLAMFSSDGTTVGNVQSCLKSMTIMEPDLILHPILERAIPALEALVETQRTMAVIQALGSVALGLVSRDIYYPGAKHLVPLLQLLIPGIDVNDPNKTLVTTHFLVEISQYIKFGDLTSVEGRSAADDVQMTFPESPLDSSKPPVLFIDMPDNTDEDAHLSRQEEDALLRESTASFADWITSFVRRVILLLENLPEEGADGAPRTGASEMQVVDAVTAACSQICVHLSEPLFDLVLNMVYDYASTTVRSNAVRAVHQLVECLANANCEKTLAKFVPFCLRNIEIELDHGASSIRTTSMADPIPSDTTLHWNLAILRGVMSNDGTKILKYKEDLMKLFGVLRNKTFSKPGYLRSGKLLTNVLLTLTHTYPMDNRFVNPDEWHSDGFKSSHHLSWGKLYSPGDVKIDWHVPADEEISFAMDIFREIVEPTLHRLEDLLKIEPASRDSVWRNDFCRYLTFVRDAFGGIPTFVKDEVDMKALHESVKYADYYHEIPEMIGHITPLKSCFVLDDPSDSRHVYLTGLRVRFGTFLNMASVSLRQQGDVNTIDAVHLLLDAMRTFALVYGDSLDSYSAQSKLYGTEITYARQYAEQEVWPRAVLVRRARRYHAARLRWNSIERLQGEQENTIIDEIVQWSMWNYITVREIAQTILTGLTQAYDGVRRRAVSKLIENIKPGNDVNTVKGALWTLNINEFGRHATVVSQYRVPYLQSLFACQPHPQPSIQDRVAALLENFLGCISEPSSIVYSVESPTLDDSAAYLETLLPPSLADIDIIQRCAEQRVIRIEAVEKCFKDTVDVTLEIADASSTHWRYALVALRLLRAHIRRDEPLPPPFIKYFMDRTCDSHPSMRYYAYRAVMKSLRYIKMRTFFKSPLDTALCKSNNPLRVQIEVSPEEQKIDDYLAQFRTKIDFEAKNDELLLQDKAMPGWLVWPEVVDRFRLPDPEKSDYKPWEPLSEAALAKIRESVNNEEFWKDLAGHFSEENHATVITQDNVSCVKSIFQILEDEPFEYLKPTLEGLLKDVDHNKQRAAAELLGGLVGGMKHWPTKAQGRVWEWLLPFLDKLLGSSVKSDTLTVWTSFLSYVFYRRDPRRIQPLVDHITENFRTYDFESQSPFSATVVAAFTQSMYEELGWRAAPWMDEIMARYWLELDCKHDEIRNYIADALEFSGKVMWRPKPSIASPEVFVRECRTAAPEFDIMDGRGTYHSTRVAEIVRNFKIWREERLPGARVLQSKYDRAGIIICKWLFTSMHDVQASSNFDYILPLMPELLRFSELNDNDELARRATNLLVRMCGVIPPKELINPLIDAFFVAIKSSPSWRLRLRALPLLQIFYFRLAALISESKVLEIVEMICWCLDDENIEVREMAATTLSGILRLSPRHSIITLKNRFVRLLDQTALPDKSSPGYALALRKLHAAILGVCAIIESYPYSVEKWMPSLLADVLAEHTYDPVPISTTVRKCAQNFKKTHQDTWHEDSTKFDEEQLSSLSTLLTGSSYYA